MGKIDYFPWKKNKRNTSKEKAKELKRFPYRNRFHEQKWKIVDDDNKEYGRYREKVNAWKEIKRLKRELWIKDLSLEEIKNE